MKAKRFWQNVQVVDRDGYVILLDERELKTPSGSRFALPTLALAEAVAKEWESLEGEINPDLMPFTKMANTAIERIPPTRLEVENHLLEYLENDLLTYRTPEPVALFERQKIWDEWVDWAKNYGIELLPTTSLTGLQGGANNRTVASEWVKNLDDFELVALYEFVALTGSFVLAMAIVEGDLDAETAFDLSRLESDFQSETWGAVDVKLEEREYKLSEILRAAEFLTHLREKRIPLVALS